MKKSHFFVLLIGLVLIGSALRLIHLGHASMWVDEVNSAFAAKSLLETGQDLLPSGQGYGRAQLFTALVAASYRMTGFNEFGARVPAAFFGILSIILVAGLARRFYGDKVALVSAFLITFSSFDVGWSRVSRMYTLLQFFTLLILYFFIRGFESKSDPEKKNPLARFGISPVFLLVGIGFWIIATLWIHMLAVFILPGIAAYLLVRMLLPLILKNEPFRWVTKYSVSLAAGMIGAAILWLVVPQFRALAAEAFAYTPPWAAGDPAAIHPLVLLEFLISPWQFPLAAFFFIGVVQHITRDEREGWLSIALFAVVFFVLSFVFTHRTPTYLFYVYPLFLMVAAYGLVYWADAEILRFKVFAKSVFLARWTVLLLIAGLFILAPWLRITLNIPKLPDGVTNMAVTPEEWREAASTVKASEQDGDVVLASLPQVALYYGVHADYDLNWANLNQAREKGSLNAQGYPVDVYAGLPCIQSLEQLEKIRDTYPRGWMMISTFHLTHPNYIPEDVKKYIDSHFDKPQATRQGTVYIYSWNSKPSGDDAL